uniref:Uncharacterized protein n=1 Tax=Arundo donax TaxID=35708 RepID=A0A0A9D548_ARUDO
MSSLQCRSHNDLVSDNLSEFKVRSLPGQFKSESPAGITYAGSSLLEVSLGAA